MTEEAPVTRFWEKERLAPSWSEGGLLFARVAAGLAVTAVAGVGSFVLMFLGVVVATDCFISCGGDPKPVRGALILTAASVAGGIALAGAWFAVADRGWRTAWRVIPALVGVTAVGLTLAVLLG